MILFIFQISCSLGNPFPLLKKSKNDPDCDAKCKNDKQREIQKELNKG